MLGMNDARHEPLHNILDAPGNHTTRTSRASSLLLSNHIGDIAVLREAMTLAREGVAP